MTSLNENIFCITGPLWGKSTGCQWIPLTKASDAKLGCFLWSAPEQMVDQTIEMQVIWNAIALIMISLWCFMSPLRTENFQISRLYIQRNYWCHRTVRCLDICRYMDYWSSCILTKSNCGVKTCLWTQWNKLHIVPVKFITLWPDLWHILMDWLNRYPPIDLVLLWKPHTFERLSPIKCHLSFPSNATE